MKFKSKNMDKLEFNIEIDAPKERVWEQLWSDEGYRKWTSAFTEGSYAESDWQEGSKIRFLSPNGSGMFGIIKRKVEGEEMVFEHRGELKNGAEEPQSWAGATESYFLSEDAGKTRLTVKLDANNEFADYFNTTFPAALATLKRQCEQAG